MIDENQVRGATQEVWQTMLGAEPQPAEAVPAGGLVSASVSISGAWSGTILMNCSSTLASRVACTMFELAPGDLDDDLIADAIGEVVNMVGGKLKGLLPSPTTLSMPTVIRHLHVEDIRYPHQAAGPLQTFLVNGESLRVAVLVGEAQAVAAVA